MSDHTSGSRNGTLTSAVDITGFDTTIGFTQWANKPATANADVSSIFSSEEGDR